MESVVSDIAPIRGDITIQNTPIFLRYLFWHSGLNILPNIPISPRYPFWHYWPQDIPYIPVSSRYLFWHYWPQDIASYSYIPAVSLLALPASRYFPISLYPRGIPFGTTGLKILPYIPIFPQYPFWHYWPQDIALYSCA